MATHSSILAWKIPWTEEPNGSMHARCLSDSLATDPLSCSCLGRVRALSCVWDCSPGQYSFWVTSLWDLRCPLPPVPLWVPGIYRCPLPPVPPWIPGIYMCPLPPGSPWIPGIYMCPLPPGPPWIPGIYRCPLPPVLPWIPGIYRCPLPQGPLWIPGIYRCPLPPGSLWIPGVYRCPLPPGPLWVPGIYRCAPQLVPLWVPASPQDSRGHSLLAVHAVAVHVPFPLHVEAWEGLPVLVHTPAETPLPALGRTALWAEHRLSETWEGPALGGPINGAGAPPPGWFPSAVSANLRKHN